jgi:dCTP deaminase
MILSGIEIEKRIGSDIIIDPYDQKQLNSNSYNLRLNDEVIIYRNPILDMKQENLFDNLIIPEDGLLLTPNKLYLGRTQEYTETFNLIPMLEGRSSIGRLGLFVHITAGFGDVGFCGFWTLEMFCVQPIRIYPNIEICQIYYHTIEGKYNLYKSNKYQNNTGIQPSLLYKDFLPKV